MPEAGGATAISHAAAAAGDIADLLPFDIVCSQLIPPAPNRREPAIDWLPDFGGLAWIAYGASSLLVISHLPCPLSNGEAQVGPFFRQVIEPPPPPWPSAAGDGAADVGAVAWCPARPSEGEIAAAAGNRVLIYSPCPGNDSGSFCWRQTMGIVETFTVEAIRWTQSGDGLIAVGIEVVLWVRKSSSWEMAWKSRTKVPQTLVSATWSSEGPIATAAHPMIHSSGISAEELSPSSTPDCKLVSVYHGESKSGIMKFQLCHPQPVTMIQWRPFLGTQSEKDGSHVWRDVLLTCSLDGTVRLWSEIDSGRARKLNKDTHDQKSMRRSFLVIAVIEINQCLEGTLGSDVFIQWAIDFGGIISKGEDSYYLSSAGNESDQVGKCDWLIGVGPKFFITFWAIHCLDDISPLRFPRVTLWKKQDLRDFKECTSCSFDVSNSDNRPILINVVASRSKNFGPPVICSLLQLLPDNSLNWSQLYCPTSNTMEEKPFNKTSKERSLSYFANDVLNQDGHSGNIIQVAVHPYSCEIELAVSLDSNGYLLFWSLSTLSDSTLGMQKMLINPAWVMTGKLVLRDLCSNIGYACLSWAPSVLDEKRFLLLGHANGIDCLLIETSGKGDNIASHKMFTIPFAGHSNGEGPPDKIFVIPEASECEQLFLSNAFLLFCIWMKNFRVLSWKVVLHSEDESRTNCKCGFDAKSVSISGGGGYLSSFAGKKYYATINLGSLDLPGPQNCDHVTSVAVVSLSNSVILVQQYATSYDASSSNSFGYHMATGYSDGTLKLWKMSHSVRQSDSVCPPWELVGKFTAHQGPVNAVSVSSCGTKIASVSQVGDSNTSLCIWQSVSLMGGGAFLLEDAINLTGPVVALNWYSIGNGQLLIGVCFPNELRLYSHKRSRDQNLGHSVKSKEMHGWHCIALSHSYPTIKDFLWASQVTPVLVHDKHISLFSQWLFRAESEHKKDHFVTYVAETHEDFHSAINIGGSVSDTVQSPINGINKTDDHKSCSFCSKMARQQNNSNIKWDLCSMLDVADRLHGSLEVYHPKALLHYLYSGNWKRAHVVLKHLVESIKSNETYTMNAESSECGISCFKVPQVQLSTYFHASSTDLPSKGLQWGQNIISGVSSFQFEGNSVQYEDRNSKPNALDKISTTISQKSEVMGLIATLEKVHDIPCITDMERTQILAIIDLLGEIGDSSCASAYRSLDEPGRKFWVAVRFQHLYFIRKSGRLVAAEEFVVDSKLVAWAFQSDCQDDLLNSVLSAEPSWLEMRNLGAGLWFTNQSQLRTRMEQLARLQYLKNKNAKDCALLYIALNRLQVLAGLFKISRDEKDKPLFGFLSRNFQEEKNKAAALKNAYVLMGRHQLELAIAFFLLGGDYSSAVSVCAKNLGDEQLAIVICRLVEGYGGPLERHLISTVLLPKANEKGDYWLSCLLEWMLGNYLQSVEKLFDSHIGSGIDNSLSLCSRVAFSDPNIGQYCAILAAKNSLRNSVGDFLASSLSRVATTLAASAFNSCGLPLEALECLSSSISTDGKDRGNLLDVGNHKIFHCLLNPYTSDACNWLVGAVACQLELKTKLNLALQYISKFLRDHPSWPITNLGSSREVIVNKEYDSHQDDFQIREFMCNLNVVVSTFEQKFLLKSVDLCDMILVLACNMGVLFLGYQLLPLSFSQHENDYYSLQSFISNPSHCRLLWKVGKEISYFVARYAVSCSFTGSTLKLVNDRSLTIKRDSFDQVHPNDSCLQSIIYVLRIIRSLLKHYDREHLKEDFNLSIFAVLDLIEYCVNFASTWFKRDLKGLILISHPILNAIANDQSSFEIKAGELMKALQQRSKLMVHDASSDGVGCVRDSRYVQSLHKESESSLLSMSEDETWHLLGVCLWMHLSRFVKHHLSKSPETSSEDEKSLMHLMNLFRLHVSNLLINSLAYVSSSSIKQLASFLKQKALKGLPVNTIFWLEKSSQSQLQSMPRDLNRGIDALQLPNNEDRGLLFKMLWESFVSPQDICAELVKERVNCFPCGSDNLPWSWKEMQRSILAEYETIVFSNNRTEDRNSIGSPRNEKGSVLNHKALDSDDFLETRRKHLCPQTDFFHKPKEVLKRSGELFEAICFNSINEQQGTVASNKKGLLFFTWKAEQSFEEQPEYIWSESDWPQDGWAGCESTPIPTYVSPGIGLGSKRGTHLGLGGATLGLGSLARPGRDLTGGGAFGIPGYAGIGASGLGWGEEDDFEEFRDPPATVENIRSRALSRHPLRPFFLVGSSNTHVYLWEFGKDRAFATYGVLPAPNVPPPYALASISALQFDHFGHRFATAALDGTVCTWQLEVGGRSNVHPTDSSLCFSDHASDVAYVATSGSILAAAGCSSNGVNVAVWDTLAPQATCQASLVCHEGGARSLSVFDNDIGTGSISPLIVTGGKYGDVGLHDFRFIATGKTKRHRHASERDVKSSSMQHTNLGTSKYGENANGMIWYIPKAHLGSVTRISTIPNTSLFLTGSKDGDVKLWDAKRSQLLFHWQKLHDRHTFLQPNSRGFGGVVRAAVTDIHVLSHGFLTCGGDGSVKLIQLK